MTEVSTSLKTNDIEAEKASIWKFLIPSLIGVCLFLIPISVNGAPTVLVAYAANKLNTLLSGYEGYITTAIFSAAAILSTIYRFIPEEMANRTPLLKHVFRTGWVWYLLTLVGGIASVLTFVEVGPDWIIGQETGRTAFIDIAIIIFCIFTIGCVFLPFLTEYGLLEYVGTLMRVPFRVLFGLPGRATIDALTSWVGSSGIAVVLTARQFETGFYTARQACVIATNFSVVSVPFVIFVAQIAGVSEYFLELYGTMFLLGIICAVVTPKLPPLSSIPDTYFEDKPSVSVEASKDAKTGMFKGALSLAISRAEKAPPVVKSMKGGLVTAFDLAFAMMPAAMAIEFIALVFYEHTSILTFLGKPLVPVLELLSIPEATEAAPGVFIGLLDQFVPAVIASKIDNKVTSFVLAGLSVTQLIFFAESALLIVRSKIPLTVLQLSMIFVVRTIIVLPILALIANLIIK